MTMNVRTTLHAKTGFVSTLALTEIPVPLLPTVRSLSTNQCAPALTVTLAHLQPAVLCVSRLTNTSLKGAAAL